MRSGHAAASVATARALRPEPTSGRVPREPTAPRRRILRHARALAPTGPTPAVDRARPAACAPPVEYHFGWIDPTATRSTATAARPYVPRSPCSRRPAAGADADGRGSRRGRHRVGAQLLADPRRPDGRRRRAAPPTDRVGGLRAAPAILAGDALMALASVLARATGHRAASRAARCLAGDGRELIDGQADDLAFEPRGDVALAECVEMAARQDRRPARPARAIGAVLAGARPAPRRCAGHVRRAARSGVPGRRRPARHLGRPRGHRQAGVQRPARARSRSRWSPRSSSRRRGAELLAARRADASPTTPPCGRAELIEAAGGRLGGGRAPSPARR